MKLNELSQITTEGIFLEVFWFAVFALLIVFYKIIAKFLARWINWFYQRYDNPNSNIIYRALGKQVKSFGGDLKYFSTDAGLKLAEKMTLIVSIVGFLLISLLIAATIIQHR